MGYCGVLFYYLESESMIRYLSENIACVAFLGSRPSSIARNRSRQTRCPCGGLANDRLLLQPLHWLGCGPVRAGRRGVPRAALPLSVAPFTVALETSHLYPLHSVTASHQAACIAFQPMGLGLCTMYAPPNGSTARWATEPRSKAPCGSAS